MSQAVMRQKTLNLHTSFSTAALKKTKQNKQPTTTTKTPKQNTKKQQTQKPVNWSIGFVIEII